MTLIITIISMFFFFFFLNHRKVGDDLSLLCLFKYLVEGRYVPEYLPLVLRNLMVNEGLFHCFRCRPWPTTPVAQRTQGLRSDYFKGLHHRKSAQLQVLKISLTVVAQKELTFTCLRTGDLDLRRYVIRLNAIVGTDHRVSGTMVKSSFASRRRPPGVQNG